MDALWVNRTVDEMVTDERITFYDVDSFLLNEMWLELDGEGFYSIIEEPNKIIPERRFVYVGTSRNLKRRLREHRDWIHNMRDSIHAAGRRSRLLIAVLSCPIELARETERNFWRAKREMGLNFLYEIQQEVA
jgi:predicted GIY-YIG superfamily endonuclease